MLSLINNRSYQVEIETIETLGNGDKRKTAVVGWAVDKMRAQALSITAVPESVKVERGLRVDLIAIYGMGDREQAGFKLIVPNDIHRIELRAETPGSSIPMKIDIDELKSKIARKHAINRAQRIVHYASRLWTPRGMHAFLSAVKRHTVKKQNGYESWIRKHESTTKAEAQEHIKEFQRRPLISVVTPVYNVDEEWLRKCVESMQNQWYSNWELCLADDHSPSPHVRPLLESFAEQDSRIKVVFREENGQISKATNSAIELASGDYIGFMDNDDELAPQALYEVVKVLNEDPNADFIYSDEDKISENGVRFDPFFKPDFSPHLLLGHNYITHFVVVSKKLLDKVGPLRSEYDGSQDYDFVLRATEKAQCVRHVPQMLYHWRTLASSVAGDPRSKMYAYEAGQKAIEAALSRRGISGSVRMLDNLGTYKIDYAFELPSVAVIATSYTPGQLEKLRQLTSYPNARFILATPDRLNEIAKACKEDKLVFLDGLKPMNNAWLREMVNYANDSRVGIVGGKIFDTSQRVLNAGVTLRAFKSGSPFEMRGEWDEGIGYYFRDLLPRDMFAVTEDCMLVSRTEFEALGGFNNNLKPGIRGIDFCARAMRQDSCATLWQPYSMFVDTKHNPLKIQKDDIVSYLKMNISLQDPYASICFPSGKDDEQKGIVYSIDSITVSRDASQIMVIGWAADFHGQEEVKIALAPNRCAALRNVERVVRFDVNASNPVPAEAVLGFKVEIGVQGGHKAINADHLILQLSTSTDMQMVPLHVKSIPVISPMMNGMRKIALLRHPRSTAKRLIEKYWAPHHQKMAYQSLIKRTEQYDVAKVQQQISAMAYKPLISLLVPVYNVDPKWLLKCVESIKNQYYGNWELCLADDCSTDVRVKPTLERIAAEDSRIKVVFREKNGHISRATNSALDIATGEFVGLLDNDDELAPQALFEVVKALNDNPKLDLIYSDEDKEDEDGHRSDPHFKPDYSPDLLLSTNYISHFGVYRKSIVDEIGGFRVGYEGSQDYDLVLRFVEKTTPERIHHIPKVLYYWRTLETSTASSGGAKSYASDAGLKALQSAMERREILADVVSAGPNGIYCVHYAIEHPELVSIIIPTKNGYDNIDRCVNSIIKNTDYQNYEILIADNGSTNPRMWDLYRQFEEQLGDRFHVEEIDIPFNFSRINNLAAKKAKGKYLLFLNDDTEVISPSWITRMVSFAQLNRVGVVGAKLYYPTETIQHAVIVLGLGGAAGHIQVGFPRTYLGYFGRLIENVNYYAVTAACCMITAEDFAAVHGFDEDLAVAYNDVDLCIRVHDQLHRDNVWAHEVELYHYESVTRGYDVKSQKKRERLEREAKQFHNKYPKIVDNDPYYNPNLSRTSGNFWIREK